MSDYSQGVCQDGAAILKDGEMLTIEQILEHLKQRDRLVEVLREVLDARIDFETTATGHSCKDKTAKRYKTRDELRDARKRLASVESNARALLAELDNMEQPQ